MNNHEKEDLSGSSPSPDQNEKNRWQELVLWFRRFKSERPRALWFARVLVKLVLLWIDPTGFLWYLIGESLIDPPWL